ncbi:MAG TPA: hypothetical protein VE262_21855 [Blastocatellia bacterium]|nr:hypothetical protein [Blastocatellia bacterium]
MAISFISEHSAEYVLVPNIVAIMKREFSTVLPLYFLSSREGSSIARLCNPSRNVRILNMFARRPKIEVPHQPSIEMKLNKSLFEIAQLSTTLGIPTFAGIPLVSSIIDFGLDAKCVWFKLSGAQKEDVFYKISLDSTILSQTHNSPAVEGPLKETDIIGEVLRTSWLMIWDEALDNLKAIRRGPAPYNNFWFGLGGGYHPFNLMMFD